MLNKNYINDNFRFVGTDCLVTLDGNYQPELSNLTSAITFNGKTLVVPENTKIKTPLHLLLLSSQNHQHSLEVIAKKNSSITIIEEYVSLGNKPYINDVKIHINAHADSKIAHYKLQFINTTETAHQTTVNIDQEAGSKIASNYISKGAQTAKDILNVTLAGKNASYEIKGINLLDQQQNMSNQICIRHLEPNCTSNVLSKSIVNDRAINNFDCRIIAHNGATKTETHVINKNLLLSAGATANTAPELEVYVDDVICTHGATVGQLDNDALFYLRSRGISEEAATKMLIAAFVQEIIDQFANYNRFKIMAGLVYG